MDNSWENLWIIYVRKRIAVLFNEVVIIFIFNAEVWRNFFLTFNYRLHTLNFSARACSLDTSRTTLHSKHYTNFQRFRSAPCDA